MFDRIEAAPMSAINTRRGLTLRIDSTDWRAVMDSTQDASNFRRPDRWNSVIVPERVAQRSLTNVDKQSNGCWISRYSVSTHGYAQIGWSVSEEHRRGRARHEMVLAHRAAWTAVNGQVPVGMTIDHTCKERRCVNPDHLRLLSNVENARRINGDDFPIGQCRNGHPESERVPIARRTKRGEKRIGLTCGACMRESRARWVAANPEKVRHAYQASNLKRRARQKQERANG